MGLSYKDAGVDIEAGEAAVSKMGKHVKATFGPEVLTDLGGFGGLFAPNLSGYEQPVLVSGTDGVGTKLKLAFMMDKHDTVGIDLVAMCVNDILAQGAKPLFFLDYLATGKLNPDKVEDIVKGIAEGCQQSGAALIGGETAEMPDFYSDGEYDAGGFVVGIVDKPKVITGEKIQAGDKVIGLASNGIHSNGYSLVRKLFFEIEDYDVDSKLEGLEATLGEELLTPTRIYVKPVLELINKYQIRGIAHITGGGLIENIPRVLPDNTKVVLDRASWDVPEIFNIMQKLGEIEDREMCRTFNMGIGMVLIVPAKEADALVEEANKLGEKAYLIGEVQEGDKKVEIK
jgi:phosphoribosylformylglycinamidine cyclo-ligase